MIFDKLENLHHYATLHENVAKLVPVLEGSYYKDCQLGRNEVLGDDIFVMGQENQLVAQSETYEYHKRYADIHIVTEGVEEIRLGLTEDNEISPYDETNDYGLVSCRDYHSIILKSGYFLLLQPGELHCPNLLATDNDKVLKQVIKLKMA